MSESRKATYVWTTQVEDDVTGRTRVDPDELMAETAMARRVEALSDELGILQEITAQADSNIMARVLDLEKMTGQTEITDFEVGGISTTTGEDTTSNARMRTAGSYPLGTVQVTWPDKEFQYTVIYFGQDHSVRQATTWLQEDRLINASDVEGAAYVRFIFKKRTGGHTYTDETAVLPDGCSIRVDEALTKLAQVTAELASTRETMQGRIDQLEAEAAFLTDSVFPDSITDFEVGGIATSDGQEVNTNTARMRTGYHRLGQIKVDWNSNVFQYIVLYYDQNKSILQATAWSDESRIVKASDVANAAYVRFLFWNAVEKNNYNFAVQGTDLPEGCSIRSGVAGGDSAQYDELQYDTPENLGVINMRKRAHQLVDLQYTLTRQLTVYNQSEIRVEYPAQTELTGLLYSSSREEELFVPQTVSFHTFMTAVMNPNSYYYTRQSAVSKEKLYYGAVCSTFVSHCYGIKDTIPTTFMLEDIEGMTKNRDQSVYGLKLGDLISKRGDHVAVVTDILRNRVTGEIASITVSEAWKPLCRSVSWTPAQFQARYFDDGYTTHRWDMLYAVDYEPTPWVHVGSETGEPVYSTHLSPRRGDKANWRWGETVEVDILDQGDYTGWKLYKNDAEFQTGTISGALLSFPNLAYGSYKLCLTGPSGDSEFVYWITVQVGHYFTTYDGRDLYCEASAHNATPVSINWNYNPEYEAASGKRRASISYAIFRSDKIDVPGEAASGWKDTRKLVIPGERGVYDLRVAYQTEYGLYWGDAETVSALAIPSSKPPDEYTGLEYVEASLAWIDTGLKADGKLGLWAQVSYPGGSGASNPLFYGGGRSERLTYGVQVFRTGAHYGWPGIEPSSQNSLTFSEPLDLTEPFEVLQQSSEITVGDNTASYDGAKTVLDAPLLFGNVKENHDYSQTDKVRIYACEIFEEIDGYGEILHRKFTPVQRNADGVVGLYDLMYNEFYPSVGENSFVGPNA